MLESDWMRHLPPERRVVLARRSAASRQASLLGSRLLAEGLRRHGHDAALLSTLRHAPSGKPAWDAPLHFSLSHAGERVLCALSAEEPVGVDIEAVADIDGAGFRVYFDAAERAWADRDPRRFARLWTAKEAVVKAAGEDGLAAMPSVRADPEAGHALLDGQSWRTVELGVGAGHVAHLALRAADAAITLHAVPWHALADNARFANSEDRSG